MKFYAFCCALLRGALCGIFRIKVYGEENLPESGPLMVCANHISMWDPPIVSVCLKKIQVHYMAKKELFRVPIVGTLIRALGAYPVQRGVNDLRAIKTTIQYLKDGDCIGIFPQGTRCKGVDPRTCTVKGGVGMCAYHAKCDVLPIAIVTKQRKMRFFRRTILAIGKPIAYAELGMTDGDKEQFEQASRLIFDRICDLSDECYEKL